MLVGREMEIKDDLTWNPPTWPRAERGGKYLVLIIGGSTGLTPSSPDLEGGP